MQCCLGSGIQCLSNQDVLDDILTILRQPIISLISSDLHTRLLPQPADLEGKMIGLNAIHCLTSNIGRGINDGNEIYHPIEEIRHLCLLGCVLGILPTVSIRAGALCIADSIGIAIRLAGCAIRR